MVGGVCLTKVRLTFPMVFYHLPRICWRFCVLHFSLLDDKKTLVCLTTFMRGIVLNVCSRFVGSTWFLCVAISQCSEVGLSVYIVYQCVLVQNYFGKHCDSKTST